MATKMQINVPGNLETSLMVSRLRNRVVIFKFLSSNSDVQMVFRT